MYTYKLRLKHSCAMGVEKIKIKYVVKLIFNNIVLTQIQHYLENDVQLCMRLILAIFESAKVFYIQ